MNKYVKIKLYVILGYKSWTILEVASLIMEFKPIVIKYNDIILLFN